MGDRQVWDKGLSIDLAGRHDPAGGQGDRQHCCGLHDDHAADHSQQHPAVRAVQEGEPWLEEVHHQRDGQQEQGGQGLPDAQQGLLPVAAQGLTGHVEGLGDQHGGKDRVVHRLDHVPQGQHAKHGEAGLAVPLLAPERGQKGTHPGQRQGEKQDIDQPHIKKGPDIESPVDPLQPEDRAQEKQERFYDVPGSFSPIHDIKSSLLCPTRGRCLISVCADPRRPAVLTSLSYLLPGLLSRGFSLFLCPVSRGIGMTAESLCDIIGKQQGNGFACSQNGHTDHCIDRRGGPP